MSFSKKIKALSGFPEWSPHIRQKELKWLDSIRTTYESYGYTSIETPAIETLGILEAKGEIDKEIYLITKPNANSRPEYGLHYDLTVPFARYVAQNAGILSYPFKRYQIQKVWRGERPQRGRFREFYQCDIDVISPNELPPFYDLEVLLAGYEALSHLALPSFTIEISNRKIYEGYLEALGIENPTLILRIIDKLDKLGSDKVCNLIHQELRCTPNFVERILAPASIQTPGLEFINEFQKLGVRSHKSDTGLDELSSIMGEVVSQGLSELQVNLGFVRGFDYYTGTIFEGKFVNDPSYGSICSGGRYDDLVAGFSNKKFPGVGFSVGLTRIMAKILEDNVIDRNQTASISDVIIARTDKDLGSVLNLSSLLRKKGLRVEIHGLIAPISKQMRYANQRGARWFFVASREDRHVFEVKDLKTGIQIIYDSNNWKPKFF